MSLVDDLLLRFEVMRRMNACITAARDRINQPIADFSQFGEGTIDITAKARASIKAKITKIVNRLEADADALLATGGTADMAGLETRKPSEALTFLGQSQQVLVNTISAAPLEPLPDGGYAQKLTPEDETELQNMAATMGLAMKQYVGWLRPQIEAL